MHPPEERPRMFEELAAHGERLDGFALYVNVLVLRIGREVVVCDAGFGQRPNPNLGWLADGLASIGIRPEDVTQAFISHGHSDHIGGFVTAGKPTFPNAAVRVLRAEVDFWRGEKPDFSRSLRRDNTAKLTNDVRAALDVLAPNLQLHRDGDAVLGGAVTMVSAPGHTAGHAMLRIREGDESLLHIMDVAHHHLLMFADPTWFIEFDHEPEQAVATRRRVFAELASSRERTYGFHLPWPGIGRILPRAGGHRWEPERWSWGS
jgi:glyoxylase-like metal-dependent hydrolase (beta-lactamase superfamily II)